MSKNNLNDQVAMLVASASPSPGESTSATEALARLLTKKIAKEEMEEESRIAEQNEYRKQQLASIDRAMRDRTMHQASCGHVKPNYTSALNGQRDHQGELHAVCSYCNKEFEERDLLRSENRHLIIPSDMVGGPIR